MPTLARAQRLAERVREELADLLLRELGDPRLRLLSITDVRVDREFAYADVFVSSVEADPQKQEEVLHALKGARGFLRHALVERIPLRTFPQLRFHWDSTPERTEHLEGLIDSLGEKGRNG